MVARPALFDTNILISALLHHQGRAAAALLERRASEPAISIVTWMEVMIGAPPPRDEETRKFLSRFEVLGLEREVVERAVLVRRSQRFKLPDAVIYATALIAGRVLVTADRGDFPSGTPGVEAIDLSH